MNQTYLDSAKLLVQVAPLVLDGEEFALKGGTAINLFVRDMPRLSVDLDLVFRDHSKERQEAVNEIAASLRRSSRLLRERGFSVYLPTTSNAEAKLFVRRNGLQVKIEVNPVTRGTIGKVTRSSLSPRARAALQSELEVPVVSHADLYGGKLVAAMDRQHPRDLFDVLHLLANEGITPDVRRAFVVYPASHERPIHEVLSPTLRNIDREFEESFAGMTADPVRLADLLDTREQMVRALQVGLTKEERAFLVSLVATEPDWGLLQIPHLARLPAIRWKLQNLQHLKRINSAKFRTQLDALRRIVS